MPPEWIQDLREIALSFVDARGIAVKMAVFVGVQWKSEDLSATSSRGLISKNLWKW
jgi:hypothetical protein